MGRSKSDRVSDAQAEAVADAHIGEPIDSPVSRAYRSRPDPWDYEATAAEVLANPGARAAYDLREQARVLLPNLTAAMRYALHLAIAMKHVDWNFYPASFRRLADLDLMVKDEEGWARPNDLGRAVDDLLQQEARRG